MKLCDVKLASTLSCLLFIEMTGSDGSCMFEAQALSAAVSCWAACG